MATTVTRAISAAYVCTGNDEILVADATAGAFAVTLPIVNAVAGRKISVIKKDAGANAITFTAPAGYSIASSLADSSVNKQNDQITMVLSGIIWYGFEEAESLVKLQTATPGSAQTGHLNISGTSIAAQFSGGGAALTGVSASTLGGATFASPGAIGGTTPAVGDFTTVDATTEYQVAATKVLGAQAAAEANLTVVAGADFDGADLVGKAAVLAAVAAVDTKINNILAKLRTHGIIAT
jgi:hypothetical protein